MKIQIFDSFAALPTNISSSWNQLASQAFPFARLEFLVALETSHCLGRRTGWLPHILIASDESELLGAFILFEKSNSYGEYIFDFAWAQAHETYGFRYYPKLVSAIPFSPATGSKLLVLHTLAPSRADNVRKSLLQAAIQFYKDSMSSSFHALFIPESEKNIYEEAGFFLRHSYQFHWQNRSYETFENFLGALRSKRRREVFRERAQVQAANVTIERLTGDQLTREHANLMYEFYHSTVAKMGGYDYLTLGFFQSLFSTLREHLLFVLARDSAGRPVAGAMNLFDKSTLFGRHWGCVDEYKALHFEVCYYQGIEFAIEKGLNLFEAGAQGEHKFQRGFLPSLTYSAHFIKESALEPAIQDFTVREMQQIEQLFEEYEEHSPFQRMP